MNDLEKQKLLEAQNRASPDFGTGSLLMRPEDTSIQGASEDFMSMLHDPLSVLGVNASQDPSAPEAQSQAELPPPSSSPAAGLSLPPVKRAPSSMPIESFQAPQTGYASKILEQLKAARAENQASLNNAKSEDKLTNLSNNIMKGASQIGQGLINRSGTTNIKIDPVQAAAEAAKNAQANGKDRLANIMQDYGIIKGDDDTSYNRKFKEQTRKDDLNYKRELLSLESQKLADARLKHNAEQTDKSNAGQKELDKQAAKEYQDWSSGGDKIARNEIGKLASVVDKLKNNKVTTGGLTGLFPDQLTSNNILSARADVQSSIMGSLRALLGAQFTEKEGERVIKNTWNEADSTENNVKRLSRLVEDLHNKANDRTQKAKYFESTKGTLRGYKNSAPPQENSAGPYGDTVEKDGKMYKWNASAGKYQPI